MAHRPLNPGIRIENFDKAIKRPHSSYQQRKFSKQEINVIGKKGRDELKSILYDVHGDRPVFGYPVLSFDNTTEIKHVS